jgi:hypothetical protein
MTGVRNRGKRKTGNKSALVLSKIDNMKYIPAGLLFIISVATIVDLASAQSPTPAPTMTAVFAGGCFWCIQPAF